MASAAALWLLPAPRQIVRRRFDWAGLGWLTLYNTGNAQPELRFDDWPHQVQGGLGEAFAEFPDAARAGRPWWSL